VTPNWHEAAALSGTSVTDLASARVAALTLLQTGARAVLITGGAGDSPLAADLLVTKDHVEELPALRLASRSTHGTGCTFAAAVTAHLALGFDVNESTRRAKAFVHHAIATAPPIGRGIGPVLEARDVMQVLQNHPDAPQDLRQKSLRLAGRVIEFDPDVRGGEGYRIARDILDSGRALASMNAIIDAQGRRAVPPPLGDKVFDVLAPSDGVVVGIDNLRLARIARLSGAPQVPGAGVDLRVKLGQAVKAGDPLYRLHARFEADFSFACGMAQQDNGYRLGSADQVPREFATETF
jgi:thymidine phosphorylase